MATGFAGFNARRLKSWPYAIAVAWGFIGIAFANFGSSTTFAVAAMIAALLVFGLSVLPKKAKAFQSNSQ